MGRICRHPGLKGLSDVRDDPASPVFVQVRQQRTDGPHSGGVDVQILAGQGADDVVRLDVDVLPSGRGQNPANPLRVGEGELSGPGGIAQRRSSAFMRRRG